MKATGYRRLRKSLSSVPRYGALLAVYCGAYPAAVALAQTAAGNTQPAAAAAPPAMVIAQPATGNASPVAGSEPRIAPFSAHYEAAWKGISIGTSDLQLRRDAEPNRYVYTWTISAHGIFRLLYSKPLTQVSWLSMDGTRVRPIKYHGDDGSAEVNLEFDWAGGRLTGVSETKPIDLPLKEGTQDLNSIQVAVMQDLLHDELPPRFLIVDKDEVKEFAYAREGTARIRTALGELDTVIVSSQRPGNNRILRMWFAPGLGFVPIQAERSRDGKLEFAMRIKTLQR